MMYNVQPPDTSTITNFLLNEGVLGLLCLVLIAICIVLWRKLEQTQKTLDEVKDRERQRLIEELNYFNRIRSGGGDA